MAKIYRRPRQLHPVAELNVTNLVDLAFTLLIVFMIATPLIQTEQQTIPINLPVEGKKEQTSPPPDTEFRAISIDRAGKFYLDNKPVSFTELASGLASMAAQTKQPVIRIRADLTLQWQQVVRVMDEIKKQNLSKITFDTEAK